MAILLLFILLLLPSICQSQSTDGSPASASNTIKGDVMYWEGQEVIVKEISGREVRVRISPETKMEGIPVRLKTGDKIVATITADGVAQSVVLQIPGSESTPPGMR